jgi:hypothetical protein
MKIYNKKGLIWGICWTVLGLFYFISIFWHPDDFLPAQMKDIIFSVVLILLGISGFTRAFSKKATLEDRMNENDERNRLIKLKSRAGTLAMLMVLFVVAAVGSMIGYKFTGNAAWAVVALVCLCEISLSFIFLLIAGVYYEKRE